MSKPKLTPWFPGSVRPVREGMYEREYLDGGGPDWLPLPSAAWTRSVWILKNGAPSKFQPGHGGGDFRWRGVLK